jgi:putative regulator of septum formation
MTDPVVPSGPGSPDRRVTPDGSDRPDAPLPPPPAFQPEPAPPPAPPGPPAATTWSAPSAPPSPLAPTQVEAAAWGTPAPAGSGPEAATPPTGSKPGSRRAGLIAVAILVVPLALILWAVKDNVAADDLKVGDCFNVPTATTVKTIEHHPCTESHTAEVFHVATYTDSATTYPISLRFDSFANDACTPVFQTYVGADIDSRDDLSVGYFFPTSDGWAKGDRTITCYVAKADESAMTTSVKGSGNP